MCTGDNLETAKAIALNAGLISKLDCDQKYTCMTGMQFRAEVGGLLRVPNPNIQNYDLEEHDASSNRQTTEVL